MTGDVRHRRPASALARRLEGYAVDFVFDARGASRSAMRRRATCTATSPSCSTARCSRRPRSASRSPAGGDRSPVGSICRRRRTSPTSSATASLPAPLNAARGAHGRPVARPGLDPRRARCRLRSAALLVVLFMMLYYRGGGAIADLRVAGKRVLMPGGPSRPSASRLTLPGIAGIVLTVGMAVDANVLVLERVREELRLGKSARAAIEAGYDRAWAAILDSNVTTFLLRA